MQFQCACHFFLCFSSATNCWENQRKTKTRYSRSNEIILQIFIGFTVIIYYISFSPCISMCVSVCLFRCVYIQNCFLYNWGELQYTKYMHCIQNIQNWDKSYKIGYLYLFIQIFQAKSKFLHGTSLRKSQRTLVWTKFFFSRMIERKTLWWPNSPINRIILLKLYQK